MNSAPSPTAGKPKRRHMEEHKSMNHRIFMAYFIYEQILQRFGKVVDQGPRGPRTTYCIPKVFFGVNDFTFNFSAYLFEYLVMQL